MPRAAKPKKAKAPKPRKPKVYRPKAKPAEVRRAQDEFMAEHLRCSVCFISAFKAYGPDRRIVLHHIAGRGKGCEVPANWCALCDRCHRHYHDGGCFGDNGERLPPLTHGMILGCKDEADGLDEGLIAGLKGWVSLKESWLPCVLPVAFLDERERNL